MSWSVAAVGTKDAVAKSIAEQFDKQAKSYEGQEEGLDILSCKERVLAALDKVKVEDFANGVEVKANGSRYTMGDGAIGGMSMSVGITRVSLAL